MIISYTSYSQTIMIMNPLSSYLWLPLILSLSLMIPSPTTATTPFKLPRLGVREESCPEQHPVASTSDGPSEYETFYYKQTLDHFNYKPESYTTFQQRYVVNSKYWGGPNASSPILAYLGAEAAIDWDVTGIGFLPENAPRLHALLVYIEHRYYGKSIPFGSREEAMKNTSTKGYFNSAQAIADYAEILIHLKKKLRSENSPVIVIGGSYGGMLASWFRLKYPHVALGALASSAPILYFDHIIPQNGYYTVVTKDFKEVSKSCYETILKSWSEIDRIASQPNGLSFLSKKFNTCRALSNSTELKDYLETMYCTAAQYNHPPKYPVTMVCGGIDGAPKGSDILTRIFSGMVSYRGNNSCYVNVNGTLPPSETTDGWSWQTCSEMVMPIGRKNETMFPIAPFNLKIFIEECTNKYGVRPRPHWVPSYYGAHDIKLVLGKFGSNIIFSNGLRDPYSSGGVLESISDSIVALHTTNGSHCLDILRANASTDPQWLVEQRRSEVAIIKGWLTNYYNDLHAIK